FTATTTVTTQADLAVTKADTPDPVTAGNNLTYTISVTNNGPSDSQGVSVTDAIPANTTFVSFTAPAGFTITVPPGGPVTATGGTMAPAATAVSTRVVRATSPAPPAASSATRRTSAAPPPTRTRPTTRRRPRPRSTPRPTCP